MKKNSFDIVIVGAGPAGMFAAYEIASKSPNSRIALLDMGHLVENRNPKEVMQGFGGAGTFSDGKLHFTPKLSHEKAFRYISAEEYTKILDSIEKKFLDSDIDGISYPEDPKLAQKLVNEAHRKDIDLIVRKARHVGTDRLHTFIQDFQNELKSLGISLIENCKISDLLVENYKDNKKICTGVIREDGSIIKAKKVLVAPGRIGTRWLQTISSKYGINYVYNTVEVGVRVEFPAIIMKKYSEALYEVVFKIRTPTFDDIVRTFCSCPNGVVATEKYPGFVCVNGHSNSSHDSQTSNFAFLCEVNLTEPVENTVAYAESIARLASTIGGNKPILQRLIDLKKGRRSTWSRIDKTIFKPSHTEVTPGDISMALPHRIIVNILEGLEILDKVMPGINGASTLLYAPEVKFRSSIIETDNNLETQLKNLFVAGDASGLSGTITGAAATGIMAGRGIINTLKNAVSE
ncbi:MAG TPA: FAD-dependent oxidoreductase [Candidatus Dojkabacteria bacterium]|nr:FAD-dependent oxidoreductase [Candidatus Dojkabacteria bacterium]